MYIHAHIHIYTHVYVCMFIYVCVYTHTHIRTYICVYTRTYTYTHIHTCIFFICFCHVQFFISCLRVFRVQVFCLLRQVYSQVFCFDVMVNGIVSSIFLYNILLLVYRNATYFCVLILYPENLLNSLMSYRSCLVASLGFSMYCVSSENSESFISSFPIWIFLFVFILSLQWQEQLSLFCSDLRGSPFTFHCGVCCQLWVCHMLPLLCHSMFSLCPLSRKFFSK